MTNKIAHKIKKLNDFRGEAELFRMEPPHEGHEYVVVSAVKPKPTGMPEIDNIPGLLDPETYIFGADAAGVVVDWSDLPGSFRGAMDIPQALRNAGYVIGENAANARLVAAAPDLLQCLEGLLAVIHDRERDDATIAAVNAAEGLIAQARGDA